MNLQEIWAGNDYAYFPDKGRNDNYRPNAKRIKIIRVYKRAEFGKERESGFAEVLFVDQETGEPKVGYDGKHVVDEVRARDVAMLWGAYIEERDYRAAQEARRRKEREDKEAAELRIKEDLTNMLVEKYGIPKEAIYSINYSSVNLSRSILERELGLVSQ